MVCATMKFKFTSRREGKMSKTECFFTAVVILVALFIALSIWTGDMAPSINLGELSRSLNGDGWSLLDAVESIIRGFFGV